MTDIEGGSLTLSSSNGSLGTIANPLRIQAHSLTLPGGTITGRRREHDGDRRRDRTRRRQRRSAGRHDRGDDLRRGTSRSPSSTAPSTTPAASRRPRRSATARSRRRGVACSCSPTTPATTTPRTRSTRPSRSSSSRSTTTSPSTGVCWGSGAYVSGTDTFTLGTTCTQYIDSTHPLNGCVAGHTVIASSYFTAQALVTFGLGSSANLSDATVQADIQAYANYRYHVVTAFLDNTSYMPPSTLNGRRAPRQLVPARRPGQPHRVRRGRCRPFRGRWSTAATSPTRASSTSATRAAIWSTRPTPSCTTSTATRRPTPQAVVDPNKLVFKSYTATTAQKARGLVGGPSCSTRSTRPHSAAAGSTPGLDPTITPNLQAGGNLTLNINKGHRQARVAHRRDDRPAPGGHPDRRPGLGVGARHRPGRRRLLRRSGPHLAVPQERRRQLRAVQRDGRAPRACRTSTRRPSISSASSCARRRRCSST